MTLDQLSQQWLEYKAQEDQARDNRVAIEQQILALHAAPEEGSESFATDNGARITVTGKLSYKVDVERLIGLTATWPESARPFIKKVVVDETKLKAIRRETPKLWTLISPAIETKPAKTGVTIRTKD